MRKKNCLKKIGHGDSSGRTQPRIWMRESPRHNKKKKKTKKPNKKKKKEHERAPFHPHPKKKKKRPHHRPRGVKTKETKKKINLTETIFMVETCAQERISGTPLWKRAKRKFKVSVGGNRYDSEKGGHIHIRQRSQKSLNGKGNFGKILENLRLRKGNPCGKNMGTRFAKNQASQKRESREPQGGVQVREYAKGS